MFTERDYDGASLQRIAVRAEVTGSTIKHYFDGKLELYREVGDQATATVIGAAATARQAPTLPARPSMFAAAVMSADQADPSAAAFLHR